jgi:hypothetical protein
MIKNIFSFCLILMLASCATGPKIDTDKDATYDLTKYKSFSIDRSELNSSPSQIGLNPILLQRVERAIELSLEGKGLSKSEQPDFVVRFLIGTSREVERSAEFSSSFYRDRYWDTRVQQHYKTDKNEISIRFHDKETDDVIWYAFSRFKKSSNVQDQATVNALIARAIQKF